MEGMQSVIAGVGGAAGILCLVYWLLTKKRRTDITRKVVLITGANSGLGKACASEFFRRGCKVILAGRNLELLQQAQEELTRGQPQEESRFGILQLDLTDLKCMEDKAAAAADMFGAVDILINNAGLSYRGCIEDTDIEVHINLMTVNYFGQIALTKAILPYMLKSGGGHIVAISSVQGRISQGYRSAYAASKHALQAYFDCLRAEMSSRNIHVCVVSPGYIQTSLSKNAICGDGSRYGIVDKTTAEGLPPEEAASRILRAIETDQAEVIPAKFIHRLVIVLRALCPRLVFLILARRAQKQRNEYIKRS